MTINFSGVLLDLDGLLLDTERLQVEIGPAVLRSLGHEMEPAFFHRLVGIPQAENARLISMELGTDCRNCQTTTAITAKSGGLPLTLTVDFSPVLQTTRQSNCRIRKIKPNLRLVELVEQVYAGVGTDFNGAGGHRILSGMASAYA